VVDKRRRALLGEMSAFCRSLPPFLKAPLLEGLRQLTPQAAGSTAAESSSFTTGTIRDLADLAALMDRRSPLGLCLRRSLTRYHFLRRAGLPVCLHFGARFLAGKPDREIAGHAWLTLDDAPYYESSDNWQGFKTMLTFPAANERN
jgi:hypothetical protein